MSRRFRGYRSGEPRRSMRRPDNDPPEAPGGPSDAATERRAPDEGGRLPAILRAFRHRNYRLFFAGQFVSLVGTWMQSIAQAWLVYKLTDSAVLLGLAGFFGQAPVFLLSPVGGAVADAQNRHSILVATQATSMLLAFALAALTFSGLVEV